MRSHRKTDKSLNQMDPFCYNYREIQTVSVFFKELVGGLLGIGKLSVQFKFIMRIRYSAFDPLLCCLWKHLINLKLFISDRDE